MPFYRKLLKEEIAKRNVNKMTYLYLKDRQRRIKNQDRHEAA